MGERAVAPHRLRPDVLVKDDGTAVRVPRIDLDERDEKGRDLHAVLWLLDVPEPEREAVADRLADARTQAELQATAEALLAEGVNAGYEVRATRRERVSTVADLESLGVNVIREPVRRHGVVRRPPAPAPVATVPRTRPRERQASRSRTSRGSPGRSADPDEPDELAAALLIGGAA